MIRKQETGDRQPAISNRRRIIGRHAEKPALGYHMRIVATAGPTVTRLTMYSRVGCHLCDVMKEQIDALAPRYSFTLEVVDIDRDPELKKKYDWDVPVLLVDGEKIAKYRLDEAMLLRRLESA
jgi:glutaredoxin